MSDNNKKIEYSLLGILISSNNEKINEDVFGVLTKEDFTTHETQTIFNILDEFYNEPDYNKFEMSLIVEKAIKTLGSTTPKIIGEMINESAYESSVTKIVQNIKNKSTKLKTQELFKEVNSKIENGTIEGFEALSELETQISDIQSKKANELITVKEVLNKTMDNILKRKDGNIPEGFKTGFQDYDKLTNGFQRGTFNIIAARPAMGKTAFALKLATEISKDKNVVLFSLEMPPQSLMERALSAESKVESYKIKNGELSDIDIKILNKTQQQLQERKLSFNTTYSVPIDELIYIIKKENRKNKLDMIVIDYLQLIEPPKRPRGNREQEVAKISRLLKSLSLELNIPIIALSQLSRGVEHRENKRPMMSDLRESGAIEQDADLIMFLYRDDYYNPQEELKDFSEVEIILSKHRQGATGKLALNFDLKTGDFTNKTQQQYNNIKI